MQNNPKNRGFAAMDRSRQQEIARKGGKAAHQKGTAHEFTADEARAAGRKGGEAVSANRGHMSHIGRIGGKKSAGRRKQVHPQKSDIAGQAAAQSDAANNDDRTAKVEQSEGEQSAARADAAQEDAA